MSILSARFLHSFPKHCWKTVGIAGYFLFWTVYFAVFWARSVYFNAQGELVAGHINIWGDWAAHFTMTSALLARGPLISSPFLLNAQFSYPFFVDFVSACLLKLYLPFLLSFLLPSFLFSVGLVFALYFFYRTVWQSKKLAILASLIFLLNGGMGFSYYFQDVFHSAKPIQTIINPLHEYTHIESQHIEWISVIDSMVIPQRAFLMGFPIALIVLSLVWRALEKKQKTGWKKGGILAAGLLFGLLPIIHTHSFLAVAIILAWWFCFDLWSCSHRWECMKLWVVFGCMSAAIAFPLLKMFFIGHITGSFFHWYPGWLAKDAQQNWLFFWWQNWGVTPWLAGIASMVLMWKTRQKKRKIALQLMKVVPFWVLFGLANLVLFQPYAWDNTKIIVWSSLGISALAASCLGILFTHLRKSLALPLAVILFLLMIFAGTLDAYRAQRIDLHSYTMYSQQELSLADWAKQNTDVDSVWLTSDQHNHWLYNLTGRQAVMVFRGWLWTHGYAYRPIEDDVFQMFTGAPNALSLLQKYHVQYVVIGISERRDFYANEAFFSQHFPIVKQNDNTKIYKIF
jgi:hypothetical protein